MNGVDWSIVKKASTGVFPGLGMESRDVDFGAGYWGNIPDHSVVNTTAAARQAREVFKAAGMTDIPLGPAIPDELIRKAVFGYYEPGSESDHKLEDQFIKARVESICAIIKQQNDYAELFGIRKADIPLLDFDDVAKGPTTSSSNLMHTIYDGAVSLLYKRAYPIQALIPTEANKGKTAAWDAIAPFDLGDASFVPELGELTASRQSPYNRTAVVKYMATVIQVTKAAQFAGLSQTPPRDMLAIRIDAGQDAMRALRERAMLGVNLALNDSNFAFRGTAAATALEYNGLYQMITANTSGATGTQTWVASTGATYNDINKDLGTTYRYMRKFGMMPNLAICDLRVFDIYKRGLQDFVRAAPATTYHQGISKIYLSFPGGPDGLPLIATEFLPQTAAAGSIMMIDTAMLARRVLWQDMYEDLAKINLSQMGVISASETFIDKTDVDGSTSYQGGVFAIA